MSNSFETAIVIAFLTRLLLVRRFSRYLTPPPLRTYAFDDDGKEFLTFKTFFIGRRFQVAAHFVKFGYKSHPSTEL